MPKKSSGGQRAAFNPGQQYQLPTNPGAQLGNASGAYQWMINNHARKQGIDPMTAFQNNMAQHQMANPNWMPPQFGLGWFGQGWGG